VDIRFVNPVPVTNAIYGLAGIGATRQIGERIVVRSSKLELQTWRGKIMYKILRWLGVASFLLTSAIAGGVIGTTPDVQAAFKLSIDDLGTTEVDVTIYDNQPGVDQDGQKGVIDTGDIFVGSFGLQLTTALSKPLVGSLDMARLDVSNLSISSSVGGTLLIQVTDTDFLLNNPASGPIVLQGYAGGATSGTVAINGFLDANNAEFGMPGNITVDLGTLGPLFAKTVSATDSLPGMDHFALMQKISVIHDGGFQISGFDSELRATVPEASASLMLAIALFGLSWYGKFYRRARK